MNHTELRWIEIADERLFCLEAAAGRMQMTNASAKRKSPTAAHHFPGLCQAMSSLPARVLSALHKHHSPMGRR
jgi:hypothetical protein